MISDEHLQSIVDNPSLHTERNRMIAAELLAFRPCRHTWNVLRLVEAGGRYQYCTLCGAKKVSE